jgi:hypothetical protein
MEQLLLSRWKTKACASPGFLSLARHEPGSGMFETPSRPGAACSSCWSEGALDGAASSDRSSAVRSRPYLEASEVGIISSRRNVTLHFCADTSSTFQTHSNQSHF